MLLKLKNGKGFNPYLNYKHQNEFSNNSFPTYTSSKNLYSSKKMLMYVLFRIDRYNHSIIWSGRNRMFCYLALGLRLGFNFLNSLVYLLYVACFLGLSLHIFCHNFLKNAMPHSSSMDPGGRRNHFCNMEKSILLLRSYYKHCIHSIQVP